jgi:hypothetical protein
MDSLPVDPLEKLIGLFDSARDQARAVGDMLESGRPAETLTERLREQADTMVRFQALLAEFRPEQSRKARSEIKRRVEDMRTQFEDLVKVTEANHRLASKKGVRLSGLGGKPHTSPAPPIRRAPEDG